MSKSFKIVLLIILIFLISSVGLLIYLKLKPEDKTKKNVEYKITKDISFKKDDIELILYSNDSYFMYQNGNINSGTFKIIDNNITLTQTKEHSSKCYIIVDSKDTNYTVTFDSKKELLNINIGDNTLNIVDNELLENTKKILSNGNIDCSTRIKKIENEKFEHDIVIENKKITYPSSVKEEDKEEISEFLKEFYDRYFEMLNKLEYKDISDMFDNEENAYIYKTALELLIENRKNSENDLSISNPKYELTIKNYSKNGNQVSFLALENCSYNFEFIKKYTSSVYNIENNFTLIKKDGKYKIKSFKKVQDFYVMITDMYSSTSNYKSKLDSIKKDYLSKFKSTNDKLAKMKEDYLNNNYTTLKCDHEYDRNSSYKYATTYVGIRNKDKWSSYSGSNCVNFASQVMYAGGIPKDNVGSYNWTNYNYAWVNVGGIKEYFKYNTGYGLCGRYSENMYLGDTGDVVTVGSKSDGRHAISVIRPIQDEYGNTIDLLVSSNTVDLIYFPLSAYAYPYKSLLKVYGYND